MQNSDLGVSSCRGDYERHWKLCRNNIFFGAFAAFLTWILYTCAADARRRGKSPRLVTLLVFISFPLGLIVWLLFRPEPLNGAYKGFRLKDHRLQ
jgi:hypothetical protein